MCSALYANITHYCVGYQDLLLQRNATFHKAESCMSGILHSGLLLPLEWTCSVWWKWSKYYDLFYSNSFPVTVRFHLSTPLHVGQHKVKINRRFFTLNFSLATVHISLSPGPLQKSHTSCWQLERKHQQVHLVTGTVLSYHKSHSH